MMSSTRMLLSITGNSHEILNELMLARGLKQKNYGSKGKLPQSNKRNKEASVRPGVAERNYG